MHKLSIKLDNFKRIIPYHLQVRRVYYFPRENSVAEGAHPTLNFTVVLDGKGFFHELGGKKYIIDPPCAFLPEPGVMMRSGPCKDWEIFSFNYKLSYSTVLKRHYPQLFNKFLWEIKDINKIRQLVGEIYHLCSNIYEYGGVDRLDRACEIFMLETILSSGHVPARSEEDKLINDIAVYIEKHYLENIDLHSLVKKYGISFPTFYRYWKKIYTVSPLYFAMNLKIEEACRLLTETTMRVNEIAESLKFEDHHYFCRKFKQFTGLTALQYRKQLPGP